MPDVTPLPPITSQCCPLSGSRIAAVFFKVYYQQPPLPCVHAHSHAWCFSDHASWIDYILITNLIHWLLFIHKILYSSTCFKPQVLIFRRIQLYTCSIWYCHYVWEFVVACRYTVWVLTQTVYRQATTNSRREWQYHMLRVYNCILLKMSTWGLKHVEEYNILWINNNQCIKLVINI